MDVLHMLEFRKNWAETGEMSGGKIGGGEKKTASRESGDGNGDIVQEHAEGRKGKEQIKINTKNENPKTRLEVLVEKEIASILVLLFGFFGGGFLVGAGHDTRFLVITDAFLEEVCLAGQGDGLHEIERVGSVVKLLVP